MIQKIAIDHGVSAAQVILRWNIQQGIIPVAKSETSDRIKQNTMLGFTLSETEMEQINSLDKGLRLGPCPGNAEVSMQ